MGNARWLDNFLQPLPKEASLLYRYAWRIPLSPTFGPSDAHGLARNKADAYRQLTGAIGELRRHGIVVTGEGVRWASGFRPPATPT